VTPALEGTRPDGNGADVDDDSVEREIEAVVTAGDESRDTPALIAPAPTPTLSATDVKGMFTGLTVRRTDRGGLVIEAPPEIAATPRRPLLRHGATPPRGGSAGRGGGCRAGNVPEERADPGPTPPSPILTVGLVPRRVARGRDSRSLAAA
jgi:hypothetical protein